MTQIRGPMDAGEPADSGPPDSGIACVTAATCPATGSECIAATCVHSVCGVMNVVSGTALSTQTAGTCQKQVCDGMGGVTSITDDTNVPQSLVAC